MGFRMRGRGWLLGAMLHGSAFERLTLQAGHDIGSMFFKMFGDVHVCTLTPANILKWIYPYQITRRAAHAAPTSAYSRRGSPRQYLFLWTHAGALEYLNPFDFRLPLTTYDCTPFIPESNSDFGFTLSFGSSIPSRLTPR